MACDASFKSLGIQVDQRKERPPYGIASFPLASPYSVSAAKIARLMIR